MGSIMLLIDVIAFVQFQSFNMYDYIFGKKSPKGAHFIYIKMRSSYFRKKKYSVL